MQDQLNSPQDPPKIPRRLLRPVQAIAQGILVVRSLLRNVYAGNAVRRIQRTSACIRQAGRGDVRARIDDHTRGRREAEEELKREKLFTESALDTLTDPFVVFDLQGRILRWNKAVNDLTGLSNERVSSMSPTDFFTGVEAERADQAIGRVLAEGHAVLEASVADKNNKKLAYEFTGDLLKDGQGNPSSICVVGRDITDRKAAEEKIRQQNDFLKAILESMTHPFYVIDAETYEVLLGNSASGMGRVAKAACYHLAHGRTEPCDTAERPCPVEEVKQTGKAAVVEHSLLDKRGQPKTFEVHAYPLFNEEGKVTKVIEYSLDITARKQVEQELRESEMRYRILAEASFAGIYIHQNGRFVYVNQRLAEMLGYTPAEMLGEKFWTFVHPDDRDFVKERGLARSRGEHASPEYEFRAICKNGETKWLQLLATTIAFRGSTANMGNVVDVTERKRIDAKIRKLNEELERRVAKRTAELQAVNRELEDFAYVVSHDLRAPLRAINQLAGWFAEDYSDVLGEDGKEQLSLLMGRAKRMESLIQGILQYSRIGRVREEEKEVNLGQLIREAIDLVTPAGNIRVIVEDPMPVVICEPTRMRQVFQNLVDNAVKHMDKPDGEIRIRCRDENEYWELIVSDNGPGIPEKYHERIFQMFQTLSPRDQREATGIGLTLVKKIVEQSGGRITVEAEVHKGTTFRFTMPKGRMTS